jgi:hypothetical protein
MWAKKYMSDPTDEYVYMGTITTWRLYQNIIRNTRPKPQGSTEKKKNKAQRSSEALKGLYNASRGMFKEQYETRLVDAIAVFEVRWPHFDNSASALPQHRRRQWLPAELAIDMSRKQLRRLGRSVASLSPPNSSLAELVGQGWSESQIGERPQPLHQRLHTLALSHGIQYGPDVPVSAPFGGAQPATLDEFRQRPVAAGIYAAPSTG